MITHPTTLIPATAPIEHTPPPGGVSEASKALWRQLANHLAACERPIADCRPCSDAFELEPYQ